MKNELLNKMLSYFYENREIKTKLIESSEAMYGKRLSFRKNFDEMIVAKTYFNHLVNDGYITRLNNPTFASITELGCQFIEKGGYK